MIKFLDGVKQKTPFIELLILAVTELQIPEDELLDLEFSVFEWLLEAYYQRQELLNARSANLMCLIANIHRGKNSKPFKPKDFMPKKPKTDKELESDILGIFGIKPK